MSGGKRRAFSRCAICGSAKVRRLVDRWQDGRPLPIVACGNPWHYATASLGDAPTS